MPSEHSLPPSTSLTMPKSVAHWSDPFTIAAVMIGIYWALRDTTFSNLEVALAISFGLTVWTCSLELWRAPWRKTPRPVAPFKDVLTSASLKWLGCMTGLCLTLFCWYGMQEYQRGQFIPMFKALPMVLPYVPVVVFITLLFTEWRLGPSGGDGKDLGLLVLLRWKQAKWEGVRDELLSWFIKGFFLIINFAELPKTIKIFRGKEEHIFNLPWVQMQPVITIMIYGMIIASILPGYLFSARIFNTHVRRIADSWFAYIVTVLCYSPLVLGMSQRWFNFHPYKPQPEWMKPWVVFFQDIPVLFYTASALLLLCEIMHYWGEAILGIRSSNLTNRGIITSGPYRYCKHPVFTAKCISWGIMWLPFMSGETLFDCIRFTFAYVGVCYIFAARCWAEERILAEDRDYVMYALWVDQHGFFAPLSRVIPLMQFRWRLKRWITRGEVSADVVPEGIVL